MLGCLFTPLTVRLAMTESEKGLDMLELQRFFSAVLFDMDGTLLDSRAVVERVWRDWAKRHGLNADAILAVSHGRRTIDVVREFSTRNMDCVTEAAKIDLAETADTDGIVAVPGAVELLARLPKDRWAVVTSAGRELAICRMNAAGIPVPSVLVTAEDVTLGKPDPSGYLKAAAVLGTSAKDCLIFEDAPAGIEAGINAGSHVVAIQHAQPHPFEPKCPIVADFHEVSFQLN